MQRESRTSGHWRIEEKQVDKQELSADEKAVGARGSEGGCGSYCKRRTDNKAELRLRKDGEDDEAAG